MINIPKEFVTTIISATSVILGSLIGAVCSFLTAKHSFKKNMELERKILKDNRNYDKVEREDTLCENANIIKLDIYTAIFQSIRNIQDIRKNNYINRYPIPINKNYSKVLSSLNKKFDLRELSYIYELYAIIEILNKDLKEFNENISNKYELIKHDCELLLKKVYGINYIKIQEIDVDKLSYVELYNNIIIKDGYKRVFVKLDKISCVEKSFNIHKNKK